MDLNCAFLVGGFSVIFVAMGYGYKIHIDRKTIKLTKNDKEHEKKHHHNEERIKVLEEKNGKEQKQIDEVKEENKNHKKEIDDLKNQVIKLQEIIISDAKTKKNQN